MTRAHWLDRAYVRLTRPGSFFEDGWGGEGDAREHAAPAFAAQVATPVIRWGRARRVADRVERAGTFESPLASELPAESRVAHVTWISPARRQARAAVVLLGATGDVGPRRRARFAAPLVRDGVGALILENPYYGPRKPPRQRGVDVRTVADLLLLGRAAVDEARALVGWASEQHGAVALSGYSMGGQLSAMAAATLSIPVAVVPVAAPASASAVFVDGLLSRATSWRALSGVADPRAALVERLDALSLPRLPVPVCPRAAILVGARRDGYVAPRSVEALHRHWPGSELRWIDEGHVSGYVRSAAPARAAVLDALERLRAASS
ncbi:MAG: alpha/beta hydrolase family protein [Polyangiaceae bacterium]|nr:alpha/beta hydrolase family protein [Polyangiaceae bacterium]